MNRIIVVTGGAGGISRLMVYHNDCGWTYEPSASGKG
jgi:hypothetical protein